MFSINCIIFIILLSGQIWSETLESTVERMIADGRRELIEIILDYSRNVNKCRLYEEILKLAINTGNLDSIRMIFELGNAEVATKFTQTKCMMKIIVDLQATGSYVAEEHLTAIEESQELKSCKEECEREMKLIKEQKFGDDTFLTLHSVWKAKLTRLTAHLQNKSIERFVKSRKLYKKFPIYADLMMVKFNGAFDRMHLQKEVCDFFQKLSDRVDNRLPKLPATCTCEIFNCLDNGDLINLRDAYV